MAEAQLAVEPAARLPSALRRQQLLRLSGEGWARVLDAPWDSTARQCLALWAARGLPLCMAATISRMSPEMPETPLRPDSLLSTRSSWSAP